MELNKIILFFAILTTGLMAGLFYTWSFSVTRGITKLSDANYIEAMQSLNRAILNPAFFFIFLGSIISLPLATIIHYKQSNIFEYLLIATIIYLLGSIAVTFLGNIPLNNLLEAFKINSSTSQEITSLRQNFETKWNNLNMVRTVSSLMAFIVLIVGCIRNFIH
jgi:uncharacterized membrane protein